MNAAALNETIKWSETDLPIVPPFIHYETIPDKYGIKQAIGGKGKHGGIVAVAHICPSGYASDDAQTAVRITIACNNHDRLTAENSALLDIVAELRSALAELDANLENRQDDIYAQYQRRTIRAAMRNYQA